MMQEALRRRREKPAARVRQGAEFADALRPELEPLTAWVYGSVAKGTFKDWSDTDVLVISDRLPEHPHHRGQLLYRYTSPGIEPKGWTKAEFLGRLEKRDAQLLAMLEQRVVLADGLQLDPALAATLCPTQ